MDKGALLRYYKRKDIQEAMIKHCLDKEVSVRYEDSFGRRPDILQYPKDIIDLAVSGVTSFHCSEERWSNPLSLYTGITKKEMDELRSGWDLILDIDCAFIEYSKAAAILIIDLLKHLNITDFDIKFSGNKGFHIAIPYEIFPRYIYGKAVEILFPQAPRKIAEYIKKMIKKPLGKAILKLENNDFGAVVQKTGKDISMLRAFIKDTPYLNAESFLEIDTILLASRHLYRTPYSLHEKSGLVSVPIDDIYSFTKKDAHPEAVTQVREFMPRKECTDQAKSLFLQAYDQIITKEDEKEKKEIEVPAEAIPEEFFPPCITHLQKGLMDGRKRAVFIIINFLQSCGWGIEQITEYVNKWNEKNPEPVREVYIKGQLKHAKTPKMPPNCDRQCYYLDMGICHPNGLCKTIRNPVQYVKKRLQRAAKD